MNELIRSEEEVGRRIYEMCKWYLVEIRGKGNNYPGERVKDLLR